MAEDCPDCTSDLAICEEATSGPTVVVAQPVGTKACDPDMATCPPSACCSTFDIIEDGAGDSFGFSAGGPFRVGFGACGDADGLCPPPGGLAPLLDPPEFPAIYVIPGPLNDFTGGGAEAGLICFGAGGCSGNAGGVAPGSYELTARLQVVDALPGMRVVVLFFPDCQDPSVRYIVADFGVPCMCAIGGGQGQCVNTQPVCTLVVGELTAFTGSCNPGFQLLVQPPCAPICVSAGFTPFIQNFQFGALRLTNQDIVGCNASPLVSVGQYLNECQVFSFDDCATFNCGCTAG